MSDSSSEADSFEIDLGNLMDENGMLQGFSFEPSREDYQELWNAEWGSENANSSTSSEGSVDEDGHGNRRGSTEWCECSNCISMPTEAECQCCKELIAVYTKFMDGNHGKICFSVM